MAIPKVVLFYAFRPLADPEALRLWQRDLCEGLGLRGRILLSPHGINATVGGDVTVLKTYVRKTREYAPFHDIDVKWSDGTRLDDGGRSLDFPRLVVKVREELVSFGVPDEVVVDAHGVVGGGARLRPEELDALVAERGDDVVLFDAATPSRHRSGVSVARSCRTFGARATSSASWTRVAGTTSRAVRSSPTARAASGARC